MIKQAYDTLKIEYSTADRSTFKILLIGDENVISSSELTSLDAARIHHVLANIEPSLRGKIQFTTDQLSATAPLLSIKESQLSLYINRLELYEKHADEMNYNVFYFTFRNFDDIDQIKNYFAEAQY